jgi:hypothetical protein
MQTDITIDSQRIAIKARGVDAIAAAEAGADLWIGTPEGWELLTGERRAWALRRARDKRAKVSVGLFGSTERRAGP